MSARIGSLLGAALALGLAGAAAQASPRLLLVAPGVTVETDQPVGCSHSNSVLVTAEDPALFGGGSARLQSLLDSARAILGYECPIVDEIVIRGQLKGLDSGALSYAASASAETDWRLREIQILSASVPTREPLPAERYAVLNFTTGMPVRAALDNARQEFGESTVLDSQHGEMRVSVGACTRDARLYRAEPGTRCLRARFTDETTPRLFDLHAVQVVDQDQLDAVRALLHERYGAPSVQSSTVAKPAVDLGADARNEKLAWGPPIDVRGEKRYPLAAEISATANVTVLTLWLNDPPLLVRSADPQHEVQL